MRATAGFVCAHHHSYGRIAPTRSYVPSGGLLNILERHWWRVDQALDHELIFASAQLTALEALTSGCTAVFDHHESPNAIEGSLSTIAEAFEQVGVRVNCSYGVTDRHGPAGAKAGIEENKRYLESSGTGMVGLHAAFTCSPDTIAEVAELAKAHDVGVHVHVAELETDNWQELVACSDEHWLLAHGVYLPTEHDLAGTIVHNPRSNIGNGLLYADPVRFPNQVALGTDGVDSSMTEEQSAAAREHDSIHGTGGAQLAERWTDAGRRLFPEVFDDEVSWLGDTVVGVRVNGKTVLDDEGPTLVDPDEVIAKANEAAHTLAARLNT